jgi:hypothetical protein
MATTTPNYGWPVPTSTDFVKDGAQAIEDLGDAIDATVFTLPTTETVLASGNFTSVAAVNLSNVLSSTYKYYNLRVNGFAIGTDLDLLLRFRENVTDKATAYYGGRFNVAFGGGTTANGINNATQVVLSVFTTGGSIDGAVNATIFRPSATQGLITANNYIAPTSAAGFVSALNSNMTNFTGLSLFVGSNTMTGSYILTGIK